LAAAALCFAGEVQAQPQNAPQNPPQQGWTLCATEHGYCKVASPAYVRFGLEGSWLYRTVPQGIACTNQAFGADPAKGFLKRCETLVGPKPGPTLPELHPLSPSD
jgi:hypothetical protein